MRVHLHMNLASVEEPRYFAEILIHTDKAREDDLLQNAVFGQRMSAPAGLLKMNRQMAGQMLIFGRGKLEGSHGLRKHGIGIDDLFHV